VRAGSTVNEIPASGVRVSVQPLLLLALLSAEPTDCTHEGIALRGRVKVVDSFADVKVRIVTDVPDLRVKWVDQFPDDCGEWQIVESFPDFTIQFVESFADVDIRIVESFPGR
jgi:hypothetical protein